MSHDRYRRLRWTVVPLALAALGAAVALIVWPGAGPAPSLPPRPVLGTDATNPDQLQATLADMGRQSISWNVTYMSDDAPLDTTFLDYAASRGVRYQVVTVEFWSLEDKTHVLQRIADGEVDANLRALAQQMRDWQQAHPGSQLIVRPLHEANLATYPWGFDGGNTAGNREQDFAPAWHRIWRVMRGEFPGLKFFLCPNGGDDASYDWGVPAREVDYVGDDRYNRSQEMGGWLTPAQVHDDTVLAIQAVYPGKPYVIAETATSEPGQDAQGHSKADWFVQLAQWMNGPARTFGIVAVCYFDHDKSGDSGNDWRVYPRGRPGAEASRRTFQAQFADFP